MQQSAGQVLASIFWNSQDIIFNDYLEKGKIVMVEYFMPLLDHLKKKSKRKAAYSAENSAVSLRQCNSSHIHVNDGKIK